MPSASGLSARRRQGWTLDAPGIEMHPASSAQESPCCPPGPRAARLRAAPTVAGLLIRGLGLDRLGFEPQPCDPGRAAAAYLWNETMMDHAIPSVSAGGYGRRNNVPPPPPQDVQVLIPGPGTDPWQKGLCRCEITRTLRWAIFLGYPGGPSVSTRGLVHTRGRQEREETRGQQRRSGRCAGRRPEPGSVRGLRKLEEVRKRMFSCGSKKGSSADTRISALCDPLGLLTSRAILR